VPPVGPESDWNTTDLLAPWWEDKRFIVGALTTEVRVVRVINTLTRHDNKIECCKEETMNEILDRYLAINCHAASYTWKRTGKVLDMDKTLDQNGIHDDKAELQELGMSVEEYIPGIHLYYNDDLTIM
jgi:hypothetical protein